MILTTTTRGVARAGELIWLPIGLMVLITVLDVINRATPFQVFLTGLLDEPAHLATSVLILLALAGGRRLARHTTLTVTALAASLLIDIDHIPLFAGVPSVADDGGRPYSHSLTTVVVLAAAWFITGRRWPVLAGAAIGVCLHFTRDIATGPGLQLLWPVSSAFIRMPYAWYLTLVVVLALVCILRALIPRRSSRAESRPWSGLRVMTDKEPSEETRT